MNLRNRFILPTMILILLGMGISSAIPYVKSRQALLQSLSEQLRDEAETIVRLTDEAIENIRFNFIYWSDDATLTTVVQEYLGEMVGDSADDLLRKIRSGYGYYERLLAADAAGEVIASTETGDIGGAIGDRRFFRAAMAGEFFISDVYADPRTGRPVFTVSGPLFMKKEIVGALCGVVAVAYFNDNYIRPARIGAAGYAFVFGRDGRIIAHPDPGKIFSPAGPPDLPERAARTDGEGVVDLVDGGAARTAALSRSEKMGWTVVVAADREEFLEPVKRMGHLNLIVLLVISVFVLSALFWLVQTVTGQIQEIMDLRIAKEGAEAASRSKSEFLANMSHEIRTPMNAVLGFSDLLASEIVEPKQKKYLEAVRISGKNLLRLINDILDLSKIEAGKLELVPVPVDPRRLFAEIREIFRLDAERKGLELTFTIDPEIPPLLMVDEVRLRQILVNLAGNAVKFTDGGWVRVLLARTGDRRRPDPLDLSIAVSDSGAGIPPDALERIFEAFNQAGAVPGAGSGGGTGLGLTITRNLVRMMNGGIDVESRVGHGTTFRITLPGIRIASPAKRPGDPDPVRLEGLRFQGAAVLVVDDNDLNRELIAEVLRSVGLTVAEGADGGQGVDLARSRRPDLILMDIKMPVMDGFAALSALRDDPHTAAVPVVALTASAMEAEKRRILESAFDGYLVKPVERPTLLRTLTRFLDHRWEKRGGAAGENPMEEAPEPLSALAAAGLPDRVRELEAMMDEWRRIRRRQYIPDMKAFADRLREMGEAGGIKVLSEYGRRLRFCVDSYDISEMSAVLERFPELIQTLKRRIGGEHGHGSDGSKRIQDPDRG